MLAICNAGFELTDEQRHRRSEMNGWYLQVYGPESVRLNEAIREGREVHRRLSRLDWKLVSKIWHLKQKEKLEVMNCFQLWLVLSSTLLTYLYLCN